MSTRQSFDVVLDLCLDEVRAGRRTVEQCLARWPQHAVALESLLRTASALGSLVSADAPVNPARRAAFMAALATTPQQRPRWYTRSFGPRLGAWFGTVVRAATIAAPVTAVALALLLGRGMPAEAATLTVFGGVVERVEGDHWVGVADDAHLAEGMRLRTDAAGRAVLTFADGSTVAIDPQTELAIERARVNGSREIVLRQWSGRLWSQVAPDDRADASFTIRTPDATVVAHGTVFETTIGGGETAVSTAEGEVEVTAGTQKQRVGVGESATARPRSVAPAPERARANVPAEIEVRGPFVASLIGPDGRATGTRPDGIVYQQIPGAVSGFSGDGQHVRLGTVDAGQYTLVVRRTGEGAGQVRFRVGSVEREVALDSIDAPAPLALRVSSEGGRTLLASSVTPATSGFAPAGAGPRGGADGGNAGSGGGPGNAGNALSAGGPRSGPAQERVVVPEKQRERVEQQRAAAAAAASATVRPAARPSGTARPGTPPAVPPSAPARPQGAPSATAPPSPPPSPPLTPPAAAPRREDDRDDRTPRPAGTPAATPVRPLATPQRPSTPPVPPVVTPTRPPTVQPNERRSPLATPAPLATPPSARPPGGREDSGRGLRGFFGR